MSYYIIVKHKVSDGDNLQIAAKIIKNTDAEATVAWTLNQSYDGNRDDDNKLTLFKGTNFSDTCSQPVAGQEGNTITSHIWHNVATNDIDAVFVNYENGQGLGSGDIRHMNLTKREKIRLTRNLSTEPIRRLAITSTGENSLATQITVCRKPILALGDSFCSARISNATILSHVGNKLQTQLTEDRFVINGGISGNKVLTNYITHTALFNRWDSYGWDLISYRDVVAVFVNGPGLNDVAQGIGGSSTDQDCYSLAALLAGTILRMAGQAKQAGNDVVLCGQTAYTAHTGIELIQEQKTQKRINDLLKAGAYTLNVPYVDSWSVETDGTHPTSAGDADYAERIRRSYESNIILNPFGEGTGIGDGLLQADLNGDGRVDLADLTVFASEWLYQENVTGGIYLQTERFLP